jgi:large subunit ribosomal protein L19
MLTKLETFNQTQMKKDLTEVKPGDTIRISQKITAAVSAGTKGGKEKRKKEGGRIEHFEGLIIAKKHGKEMGSTITVRKEISGVGVERIFPLHLPSIEKIEVLKKTKVRRAKLYYLRTAKGRRAKLKEISK